MKEKKGYLASSVKTVFLGISYISFVMLPFIVVGPLYTAIVSQSPANKERVQAMENAQGKPVSEIFNDNAVLGYTPTENNYPVINSYQKLKTDNYAISFSDGFYAQEILNKPLCTYVNIENSSQDNLIFDRSNFSSDFNKDSSAKSDDLKKTTIFDGNNQELSEVIIKPSEEEIFILCRDSDKGKGVKNSQWSLKSDDNTTISQWVLDYDRTLDVRTLD